MPEINIPEVSIQPVQGIAGEPMKKALIPFSGKLITASDPVVVGKNYRTMTNMRYGDVSPEQIAGMTKINTTALGTYLKVRSAFHFRKMQPSSIETHILAHAYNSALSAAQVLQNTTAPPAAGDFSASELWTDSAGAGIGMFSDAPDGNMIYCNGVDTCIWGGDESRCARFLNFSPANTFVYDYTDAINNTKQDSENVAVLGSTGGGLDSDTVLLLHLNGDVLDSSTYAHIVTNNNVTFSNTVCVWGYSGVFNGTTAYIAVRNSSNLDFSGGEWEVDVQGRFDGFTAINPLYYHKTDLAKISFDSGAHEPVAGEIIHGATTGALGVIDSVVVASGDWGGTAAGTIYMHTLVGTWDNAAEAIHDPSNNVVGNTTSTSSDAGDNYISIFVDTAGKVNILVHECYGAGSDVVSITCGTELKINGFYHIQVGEYGNTWYIFIDGQLKSITSDSSRAKVYISDPWLGYNGTNFLDGYLDEPRVSKVVRNTDSFTRPVGPYVSATVVANVYIGSLRPLQGVKFYTATENASAATAAAYEWTGSAWSGLTITDGTAITAGTKTLGQTGSITFSSTVATAKQKFIEGVPLYYYWFTFTGIDAATSIYYCTLDAPFQELVDFWDGSDRSISAFYKYTTAYTDYTVNVSEEAYDTAYADTYADLASLGVFAIDPASASKDGANCVMAGFFERMTAVNISIPSDRTNSTAASVCSVDYWDGGAWETVGVVVDGTSQGGISLAKSGTISWDAPDTWDVFTRTMSNSTLQLFYYRLRWDKAMDATTAIYHVSGIPGQKQIKGYKFPLHSQERVMLCCNTDGAQNSVLVGSSETAQVFNGQDSLEIYFGNSDALNCGCTLFAMYGSILYNITILYKDSEIWGLVYTDGQWRKYRIAETVGCPAPLTLRTCIIPPGEGQQQNNRSFAIWMAADGVYTSDGRHPIKVSWDIDDLFDQNSATHINQSYTRSFSASIDRNKMEYRLKIATTTGTVTTLDDEWVLDMRKWQWYHVNRGTGKKLQCAVSITDEYGNNHEYGFIDTGYMERLEYGTTFDGNSITPVLHTGDFPLTENDFLTENSLQALVLVMASKNTTTSDVTLTHYIDTLATGTDYTIDPTDATHRLAFPVKIANAVPGILNSFKMTITTTDESSGFAPFMLGVFYRPIREHDYA
jgi:hypothetical protein